MENRLGKGKESGLFSLGGEKVKCTSSTRQWWRMRLVTSRRVFPGYVLELAMHAQEVVQYPWDSVYILYSPPSTHFLERWNVLAARRRHCGWDSVYMRAPLLGQLWVTALLPEGDQQQPATNNNHWGDEVAYCGNYHCSLLFWCWETFCKQMFSQQWAMGLQKQQITVSLYTF